MSEQLASLFQHTTEKFPELICTRSTIDKAHGRLEERTIDVLATHGTALLFPGVQQIARLTRTREILKYKTKSQELIFLITDFDYDSLSAENFLALKRDYWAIENKLHYRKDFVFGEDRSTIRANFGPQNMSSLRNFALGYLLANNITNVKRCVDNLKHDTHALLKLAA